jgi:hypothetical protein
MDDTLEHLIKKIEERRIELERSLGDGAAKDYASYQYSVGNIQGLLTVKYIILDLAKRMESLEDE